MDDIFIVIQEAHTLDCDRLRTKLQQAFIRFELRANEQGIDALRINKSKYAAVAYIDEMAANQDSDWIHAPLQLDFFGEVNAGEKFFTEVQALRLQAEAFIDVLEVYYLFLNLGFEGKYRKEDKKMRMQLKTELLTQIQHVRKISDWSLLQVNHPTTLSKKSPPLNIKQISIAATLLVTLVWGALIGISSFEASQSRKTVQDYLPTHQ